jgi:hypothetical protein
MLAPLSVRFVLIALALGGAAVSARASGMISLLNMAFEGNPLLQARPV